MIRNPYTDPQRGDRVTAGDGARLEVLGRYDGIVRCALLRPDGTRDERAVFDVQLRDWPAYFKEPTDE